MSNDPRMKYGDLATSTQKGNRFLIPFDLKLFWDLGTKLLKGLTLVQQNNSATQNRRIDTNSYGGQVQKKKNGRSKAQHLPFVYGQNKICLARPYFILGPMLIFPSPFLSLSVTGRTLFDQVVSFSLVPKNELHAS